jgi:hypothetical protein
MKLFEKNVGQIDRIVRLVVGVVLAVVGYLYLAAPLSYVAYLLAVIMLFTGLMGTCALYSLIGINTAAKAQAAKK